MLDENIFLRISPISSLNSGFTTLPYKKQPVLVTSLGNTTSVSFVSGAWLTAVTSAALAAQVKGAQNRNHACRNLVKVFCANRREEFSAIFSCDGMCFFFTRFCCVASLSDSPEASCNLLPEKGRCMATIHRYYYNPRSHSYERFIYGGCQGNAKNF